MKKRLKRLFAMLLCLSLVMGMAPVIGTAGAEPETANTGHCGTDHTGFTPLGTEGATSPVEVPDTSLEAGGTFKLVSDIVITGEMQASADLHIDLNGFTIVCRQSGITFRLTNSIVFTLCDTSANQTGKLDANGHSSGNGVIHAVGASTFNFYGGTISGVNGTVAKCSAIMTNTGGAYVNMYGGKITGNTSLNGAALYLQACGSFKMYGGEISGNTVTGDGAAIYSVNKTEIVIAGGKITGNTSANGGTVYVNKDTATLAVSGNTVIDDAGVQIVAGTGNIGNLEKGAKVNSFSKLTQTDASAVEFYKESTGVYQYAYNIGYHPEHGEHGEGWTAVSADDGIPAAGGTVYLTEDIVLTSAVSLTGDLHLCLNGHKIDAKIGDAITFSKDVTLTLCDCDSQNRGTIDCTAAGASGKRGVIHVTNGGTLKLHGGTITGHASTTNGGGVYVSNGSFYMFGGTVTGNSAAGNYGGGVGVNGANAYFEMHGGTISQNTGKRGAGLWLHSGAAAVIHDGAIVNNTSSAYASGIFVQAANCVLTVKGGEISGNVCSSTTADSSTITCSGSLIIEGGTFDFSGACTNGIRFQGSELSISGGTFTGTAPTGNLIRVSGAAATCAISGATKIGGNGLIIDANVTNPCTIGSLTEGADICTVSQLTATDDTVQETYTESTGVYQYTYKAPTPADVVTHTGHDSEWTAFAQTSGDVTTAGKYYLTDDLALTGRLNINEDVILCLNGKTLTGMATGSNIVVAAGKTLTLCDCAGTGVVQGNAGAEKQLFYVVGTLKLFGGKITGNETSTKGAVMQVDPTGTFEMYGGEITGNKTTETGGVIYNNGGKIIIAGGKIYGNTAEKHAGVIYNQNYSTYVGTVTISGGEIYNNSASEAGVISLQAGTEATISGGKIYGNTVAKSGSVVYATGANAVITVSGGIIEENISQAASKPSTFRVDPGATFKMTGGTIRNNKDAGGNAALAAYLVGGAYYDISGTAQIDTGAMSLLAYNGVAPSGTIGALEKGASIYADSALAVLNDGTVSSATDTATGLRYYTWLRPPYDGLTIEAEGAAIANNKLKVAESAIGSTQQLKAVFDKAAAMEYSLEWFTSDETVATVDGNGLVTFKGYGSAKITVEVRDAQGNATDYYNFITVQVGEDPLRVLIIGNSFSRDSMYYLGQLGLLTGNRIQASYLYQAGATIRDHARNLATASADYTYYKTNLQTGKLTGGIASTITAALLDEEWDIVVLQQGVNQVGWPGTYNHDVKYLIDYIQGEEPNAEVYWNMTWALQGNFHGSTGYSGDFVSYYNGDQATMYNAIIDCLDQFIVGDDSVYGQQIAGWFPTGMALQELRATYGDTLTRDGYHLSLEAGRLTAAMTLLKTLVPDVDLSKITVEALEDILEEHDMYGSTSVSNIADPYVNNEANLSKVKAAVLAACETAKEGKLPEKLDAPETKDNPEEGIIEVLQSTAPLKNHFPDLVTLKDGTIITGAYLNVAHYPVPDTGMQEGVGKIIVYTGSADAQTWTSDTPLLVIDEEWMEQKGLVELSDRYARLKENPNQDYFVMIDPRDPNFGLLYTDFDGDGDEDEVVLFTFWVRRLRDDGTYSKGQSGYLMHSLDGGKTWSDPQEIRTLNGPLVKRGNIATYNDGQILLPYYGGGKAGAILLDWDKTAQKWITVDDNWTPNIAAHEGAEFTEISFVSPDGETTFALVRGSGSVMMSTDRGKNWTEVANEPGRISQPGFAILDENRIFTLWSRADNPRHIYGKVFYIDGSWTDTVTNPIYISPNPNRHDMGDPSAAVLADGRILSIFYDDEFRAIYGVIDDVNTDEWQAIELQDQQKSYLVNEDFGDKTLDPALSTSDPIMNGYLMLSKGVTVSTQPSGSHTVEAQFILKSAASSVKIRTAVGEVEFTTADGLQVNKVSHAIISIVGNDMYVKAWSGSNEPADWTVISGSATGKSIKITGSNANLYALTVSRKLVITLQETLSGVEGLTSDELTSYLVYPYAIGSATYSSSNPEIAAVDPQTGIVTFTGAGTAVITLTVDGVSVSCQVTVELSPAELTGRGETVTLLDDDFEKYTDGANALWYDYWDNPKDSLYKFEVKYTDKNSLAANTNYHIIEEDGEQYLQMVGNGSWIMTDLDFTGDATVQFDFKFSTIADYEILNITMWQRSNDAANNPNQVHAFVNLKPNGYRLQYRPERLDVDNSTATNPNSYYPGTQHDQGAGAYDGLNWCTFKMTRVEGGMYVKVWNRDEAEPETWTTVLLHDVLNTDVVSNLRFGFSGRVGTMSIDNLKITQQVEGSPVEASRMQLANSLNMQFAVPMDQQTDWTGAYAEIVRGNETVTVPVEKWQKLSADNLYVVPFEGVAAKEMTDEVVVTLYDKDGKQIGASYTDSVRDYAMRILANKEEAASWRLIVDMLNYGAAAQQHFGYKTDDLANAKLTPEQKAEGTQNDVDVENTAMTGTKSRLYLENEIKLQIVVPAEHKDKTITYAFTNHYGDPVSGEAEVQYDSVGKVNYIVIDQIVVADAQQMVEVKANGVKIAADSVESYIARMGKTDPLYQAIMKFALSAEAFFHNG